VRTYATWTHLRRLRVASARAPITYGQLTGVPADIANVIRLLAWLREHGLSLAICTQHDIDSWPATRTDARAPARKFLKWAVTQHAATNVEIPHRDNPRRTEVLPEADQRWTLVRRLLDDDSLDDGTRLAGLLVLLYAQPLRRIAALTTAQVLISGVTNTTNRYRRLVEPFTDHGGQELPTVGH